MAILWISLDGHATCITVTSEAVFTPAHKPHTNAKPPISAHHRPQNT